MANTSLWIRFLSGTVAELDVEELRPLNESNRPVRALKKRLAHRTGISWFRQRLYFSQELCELEETETLTVPMDLKLAILNFQSADKAGQEALLWACVLGRLNEVEAALLSPQDPNIEDVHEGKSLHVAPQNGHLEIVRLLLEAHADKDVVTQYGDTALHLAAHNGNLEIVQLLLEAHAGW